jgi:hypothetical protein
MKLFQPLLSAMLLFSLAAFAQSAQNAMAISDLTLIPPVTAHSGQPAYYGTWTNVLQTSLHMNNVNDLVVTASLETGLFTDTQVSSKNGTSDTSSSYADVEVRVVIDQGTNQERVAEPGGPRDPSPNSGIVYDRRTQTLIAQFGGILQSCTDANGDGTISASECTFAPETLELILDTLSAHSFDFGITNLGSGNHTITLQARTAAAATAQAGVASAKAWVGRGSLSVNSVRFVNSFSL